ncbi:MAG: hypothetical protein V7638_3839 [Acidobacteriota bacterium]|jgi:hypothetical protein
MTLAIAVIIVLLAFAGLELFMLVLAKVCLRLTTWLIKGAQKRNLAIDAANLEKHKALLEKLPISKIQCSIIFKLGVALIIAMIVL